VPIRRSLIELLWESCLFRSGNKTIRQEGGIAVNGAKGIYVFVDGKVKWATDLVRSIRFSLSHKPESYFLYETSGEFRLDIKWNWRANRSKSGGSS